MSKTTQTIERKTVNLVKRGKATYPQADADYEILQSLKVPMYVIDEDFFPLLQRACAKHDLHFNVLDYHEMEQTMFRKVEDKWPFDIHLTSTELVLKAPSNIKVTRLENLILALRGWYRKHNIALDEVTKKSSKTLKITLHKRNTS